MELNLKEITLSYAPFYGNSFEEFINTAASMGFGAVQFTPDQTPNLICQLYPERVERISKVLESAGLRCSVHAVFYDINLVSVVPEVRSAALSILRGNFELARGLNATGITVHPGYMFPGWRSSPGQVAEFWKSAELGMAGLDNLAQEYGMRTYIENGSYYLTTKSSEKRVALHIGTTIEEVRRLLSGRSGYLGLCLDLGKALVSGEKPEDFIDEFSDRLGQIQIGSANFFESTSLEALKKFGDHSHPEIVFEGGMASLNNLISMASA